MHPHLKIVTISFILEQLAAHKLTVTQLTRYSRGLSLFPSYTTQFIPQV